MAADRKRTKKSDKKALADRPIRVGVFPTLQAAERTVQALLDAGFTKEEITVICSDRAIENHFKQFEHQKPAGAYAPTTALVGGAIGAVLGGLSVVVGAAATGGVTLLATAPIAMWIGGATGGLIGAMMSRGVERELANYYDQAVADGHILVAAEPHEPNREARLAQAEKILADAGAEPIALPEG